MEDLEAAKANILSDIGALRPADRPGGRGKVLLGGLEEELAEVVRRLEHARWTKVGFVVLGGAPPSRYLTVYSTHASMIFCDDFLRRRGARRTKMASFGRSRRGVSIDASLGVCALPLAENVGIELHPGVCYIHTLSYTGTWYDIACLVLHSMPELALVGRMWVCRFGWCCIGVAYEASMV